MENEIIRQIILANAVQGSWTCVGGGEIVCEVSLYGEPLCELFGDNGTNKCYNPSGVPWVQSIEDTLEDNTTLLERAAWIIQNHMPSSEPV